MFMNMKKVHTSLYKKETDFMVSYVEDANKTQVSLYIGILI